MDRKEVETSSSRGHQREKQREQLILAAESRIANSGVASLRARDLAGDIGVALGSIYNLVADLDELILIVGSRTLARLDAALGEAAAAHDASKRDGAIERLIAIAHRYRAFASEHRFLWRALFEFQLAEGREVPDWVSADLKHIFRNIVEPLGTLMPRAQPEQRALMAHTLFCAVHGVVSLGLQGKMVAVPAEIVDTEVERLLRLTCAGLLQEG